MAQSDMQVSFGADTDPLNQALGQVQAQADLMGDGFDQLGARMSASMSRVVDSTELVRAGYAQLSQDLAASTQSDLNGWLTAQDAKVAAADKAGKSIGADQDRLGEAYRKNVNSIVSTFGSGMLKMAQHGGSFHQVMIKVVEDIENIWLRGVERMVTNFIIGEGAKTSTVVAGQAAQTGAVTAGVATKQVVEQAGHQQSLLMDMEATLKKVTNAAAAAAAAAYQSYAGIPVLGQILGAAAAAVTFTAVEAFGALASASGGYDIGAENPLTQLHAQEMVLPASIANPLRGMIASGGAVAPGGGGSGAAGGDTHNWNIQALDSRSIRRMAGTSAGRGTIGQVARTTRA